MLKIRRGLAVTGVLASAGLALAAVPAAASTTNLVHLQVKVPDGTNSVYISTSIPSGPLVGPFTRCRRLGSSAAGWKDGKQDLHLGTKLKLITFKSSDCTSDLLTSRSFDVPAESSNDNFWADMT